RSVCRETGGSPPPSAPGITPWLPGPSGRRWAFWASPLQDASAVAGPLGKQRHVAAIEGKERHVASRHRPHYAISAVCSGLRAGGGTAAAERATACRKR